MHEVLRDPVFIRWAVLAIVPAMLDEVFRAFVTLYLQDVIHADDAIVELLITFETAAGFVGLLVLEFLIVRQLASSRILAWSAVIVLFGMVGLLTTHTLWFAGLMLCIVGAASICWFPLAKAETYKRLPGRSGTVRAILSIGAPFSVILPSIVGFISGRFGITAGVGFLGLAPVIILVLVLLKTRPLNYVNP